MNINPFDILKNAEKIKAQIGEFQEKLASLIATGSSGGGMVEIDINGKMEIVAVRIAPMAIEDKDAEMLQDLIIAAHTHGLGKINEKISREMGSMAGGLGIPPGSIPGMG